MIEAALLYERHELGAKAARPWRLVDDEATAGLLHRLLDRVEVERDERAQVDYLGVEPALLDRRQRDVDHGAVGEDRHVASLAHHRRLADRNGVMTLRNFARRMLRPGLHRPVVVPVER